MKRFGEADEAEDEDRRKKKWVPKAGLKPP